MTKKELATYLSEKTGHSKKECMEVYEAFIDYIYESINIDTVETVLLPKFGKIKIKLRPPYKGRDPRNGERVITERKRMISFVFNPKIKEHLKQPYL